MALNIPEHPTHTIKLLSNWDGEADVVWLLAFKVGDEYHSWECGRDLGKPVLQHEGDKILGAWALN